MSSKNLNKSSAQAKSDLIEQKLDLTLSLRLIVNQPKGRGWCVNPQEAQPQLLYNFVKANA